MEETGFAQTRFPVHLNPTAQEFWPTYSPPPFIPLFPFPPPPPQLYYSYPPPPPPPPLPPSTPPTRALLLTSVPSDASESAVRRDLEVFGDVRAVQMGRLREGILTVHFYDLRAAHAALDEIRHHHHHHRLQFFPGVPPPPAMWAQFTIPAVNAFPDGQNQGTLVLFNLDPNISASALADIFRPFGPIRELRETPMKKHQKFIEFFDVRDAAAALTEMNGKEIAGKQVSIEFSRPGGGYGRRPIPNPHHHQARIMNSPPRTPASTSPPTSVQPKKCSSTGSSVVKPSRAVNGVEEATKEDVDGRSVSVKKCGERSVAVVITKLKTSPNARENKTRPPWKGKNKSLDPRFLIEEDPVVDPDSKDTRTTVMIKNIPNKYSQKLLLNMLDNHCIHCNERIGNQNEPMSSYDFLYLPIDFNNKCNVGYGFVNMTTPEAVKRLHKAFNQQHWEVFNSRKICQVTYARVQGLEALKEHFKNSKFACETDDYLPVVFSPPRDGRAHLTDPLPIVPCCPHRQNDDVEGNASATTVSVQSSSPSLSSDGGDVNNDDVVLGAGRGDSGSNDGEDYNDDSDVGQNK